MSDFVVEQEKSMNAAYELGRKVGRVEAKREMEWQLKKEREQNARLIEELGAALARVAVLEIRAIKAQSIGTFH